ncbi:hypothetical protein F4819DRAFT_166660 [Hypoxylon fuscum]|nr:hypothetical protein F4819DRAFT_166660 [Hypoxylon fuscum]
MFSFRRNPRGSYYPLFTQASRPPQPEFDESSKPEVYERSLSLNSTTFILSLVAIAGWLVSVVLAISLRQEHTNTTINSGCLKRTSYYSPLIDEIPGTLREVITKGTFDIPSPYRGEPSESIDQAWRNIHLIRPLNITIEPSAIVRLTEKPETAVRNAPEYGGGLFVLPEFSHHLHCVVSI